jgi:integrase
MWIRAISPELGAIKMRRINRGLVEEWFETLDKTKVKGTNDTYALMRQVFAQAVSDKVIKETPVEHRSRLKSPIRDSVILKPTQITQLMDSMPERYRAAVVIAAWCGLREGELLALRRQDIDPATWRISVTRNVQRVDGIKQVQPPKSRAGIRTVRIPKNVIHIVAHHLDTFTGAANTDLLFANSDGDFIAESSLTKQFRKVRGDLGFPEMPWHDLRHTAGTLATQSGMNMAQVMQFLGHSTYDAAMRYQSAVDEMKDYYADRMAALDPNYKSE